MAKHKSPRRSCGVSLAVSETAIGGTVDGTRVVTTYNAEGKKLVIIASTSGDGACPGNRRWE